MKSRRKAYDAIEQPEDFFQFFDAGLPPDALVVGPLPLPASKGDREKAADGSGSAGTADGSPAAADGTGIRRLLGRLKPNESERNEDDLVPIDEILTDNGSGTDRDRAGGAKDADAVSQLADIRRKGRAAADDTSRPADSPSDANTSDSAPAVGSSTHHGAAELPVAIPSTLLQGFPDGDTGADDSHGDEAEGEGEVQWSTAESVSAIAATHDVLAAPRVGPSSPLGDSTGPPADTGPPPSPEADDHVVPPPLRQDDTLRHDAKHDNPGEWMPPSDLDDVPLTEDPFGIPPDANEPPVPEERRRTLRPIGEYPTDPDRAGSDGNGGSRPIGPLDQIPDMSPRLRDLVADLSNQPSAGTSAENPFLKRSRVVSEPHGVTDFSTDPFSATDGTGSDSAPTDNQPRNRVPAPISPSSSVPPEPAGPATAPEPGTQPATAHSESARQPAQPLQPAQPPQPEQPSVQPITARTPVELPLEIPATSEQDPEPAVEAETPIAAAPEPDPAPPIDPPPPIATAPEPEPGPPIDPPPPIAATLDPESATPDPQPATDALSPGRRPIASFTPTERHPLAAFADADRHPLAAFARRDTPLPTPEPPPIDDVFPDEAPPVEVDYSVGRLRDFTDVPSIDDLLPPESAETDVPPVEEISILADEPAETAGEPSEANEPDEPSKAIEPDEPFKAIERDEPSESWETWEPSQAWETWEPPEPLQTADSTEANEPDEPLESWETWQPTEPSEAATPPDSWETGEPTVTAPVAEAEPVATESIPGVVSPESTVLKTVDDDSATWTHVDDIPDVGGSTSTESADTDARGSWIPPALRGIAPDAHEAAENLPRRRR